MRRKLTFAFVIWALVYPLVTVLVGGIEQLHPTLPLGLKTLALTLILVPMMTFVIVPGVRKRLG